MSTTYSPLHDKSDQDSQSAGDSEGLLSSDTSSDIVHHRYPQTSRRWKLLTLALIPVTGLICLGVGTWVGSSYLAVTDKACLPRVQKYSPILREVDSSIHKVRFNGSFLHENSFRKEAGPEVDAAWDSIGVNYRGISVPFDEGLRSGLEPDQVKINPKYGGGFPVNVEGLHHLHCLNLVRQALYFNIDYYRKEGKGAFTNKENIAKFHITHCLDILRQQLMCMPNTGVLGQVWWDPSYPKAFVDFNTEHKCKNFDAIREWAKERQLPEEVEEDFLLPPVEGDRIFNSIP